MPFSRTFQSPIRSSSSERTTSPSSMAANGSSAISRKIGDDYFPLPAQWDIAHQIWRPYFVRNGTDWWASLYPPDNMKRPTGPLCDGCHSVNYDIKTKRSPNGTWAARNAMVRAAIT